MSLANVTKHWRFYSVVVALFCLLLVLVVRLFQLQILDGASDSSFLRGQGDARTVREQVIPEYRGIITDRNGEPLAISTPVVSLWMNPKVFESTEESIATLSKALDIPVVELKDKLARYSAKQFVYLKRHMSPQSAEQVLKLGIQGVYGQEEYKRYYPAGEVTSHLLGYTDINNKGMEGLELAFEEWLSGEPGVKQVVQDLHRRTVKVLRHVKEAEPGEDIRLSIDLRLQYLAYRTLKAAVTKHQAEAGSIVLLDVETGEILAMANQPAFNPNDRSNIEIASVRNRAVTDMFEPGSTVKPFTITAALESGKYTPGTQINTSPGYIKVGNRTFLDPVNYSEIDLSTILKKSSQVGTTKVALSLGHEAMFNMFYRLGLGQFVGIGFPGESTGFLPNRKRWSDVEQATFSFGYGVSVTALQLAQAYAVYGNEGVKKPVSLLHVAEAPVGVRVLDESIADEVLVMLQGVTAPDGTGKKAVTEAYTVAGKTGTAHKVGAHGYEAGHYVSIFAGLAPADNPRIAVVVVIDDPKGKEYYGGEVAAPIFSEVVAGSLRMLNVAPDKLPISSADTYVYAGGVQ